MLFIFLMRMLTNRQMLVMFLEGYSIIKLSNYQIIKSSKIKLSININMVLDRNIQHNMQLSP